MSDPVWLKESLERINSVGAMAGPGDVRGLNIRAALDREDERERWLVQGHEFSRQEIMDATVTMVYGGVTLQDICDLKGMPRIGTVLMWRDRFATFGAQLIKAQRAMATVLAENVVNKAMKASNDEARLVKVQVESMKWLASKYDDRFADKQRLEVGSLDGLTRSELEEQLGMLLLNASGNLIAQVERVIEARTAKPALTLEEEAQDAEVEMPGPEADFNG